MKDKKILFICLFVILLILLLSFIDKNKEKIMECNITSTLVGGESSSRYVFEGVNNNVYKEDLYVDIHSVDESILNDYKDIITSKDNCNNLKIENDHLTYECSYDLENNHYYSDLEDSKGILHFDILKKEFENDNYICEYK